MTSGGGPEGYCKSCGEYSQSRTIAHSGLCMACNRIFEKKGCINCIYIDEDCKTGICSGCFLTSDKKNFTYKGGRMSDGCTDAERVPQRELKRRIKMPEYKLPTDAQNWARERNWLLARVASAQTIAYPVKKLFPEKAEQVDLIYSNLSDLLNYIKDQNQYTKYIKRSVRRNKNA